MAKKFNPKDYTMVKDRIKWYKEEYPDYRVVTELIAQTSNLDDVVVRAKIFKNADEQKQGLAHATGIAEELREAGFINKTSHVENAETSAVGRALANIDYHGSEKRPSAEEMDKVKRTKKAKDETKTAKEEATTTPDSDDEVAERIDSFETVDDVVSYFNEQVAERSGKEKDEFQKKYGPVANNKVQEIKS